ncbi:hypothetical protein B0H14DRAFT_3784594 [Mycena olivaceomarginata]|nr:hypothetical protein B0H14DRAFT_3784594 [Mycena olivaceomarginata]
MLIGVPLFPFLQPEAPFSLPPSPYFECEDSGKGPRCLQTHWIIFDREDMQDVSVQLLRRFPTVERSSLSVGSRLTEFCQQITRAAIIDFLSLPSLRCILFLGCAHGRRPSFLPSSILIHALSSCTAVALRYILVKSEREFIPSAVSPQGRSSLRQLVLDLPPTMVPAVQEILLDSAIVSMDTLQHLRVSRSSPPTNFSLHGLESVALRARVPNIVMDAIANLPTYMPRLEVVTVVIHANDCRETNFIAAPKADAALLALTQLRDAHFILAADSSAGAHFVVLSSRAKHRYLSYFDD